LQKLMNRDDEVTYFTATVEHKDKASMDEMRRRIEALAPTLEALPTQQYVDSSVEIQSARVFAWLTSAIALVIGAIGVINTMLTSVFERTREIAVLRAIGWTKLRVIRLIMLESAVLGMTGAAVGAALAIALTKLLARLPASGRMISGNVAPEVVLQAFLVAMLVGLLGGLYPAWRAAQLVPTEGLRHE
jgi:putative ABC transport system permease protein